MQFDRNSQTPLHAQLQRIINTRIEEGVYLANSRLPSERELCEEFGVSRTTVRETLRQLQRLGMINILAGRGAFVAAPNREIAVKISMAGYSSDLRREGHIPASKMLSVEVITDPAPEFTKIFRLQPGDEVIRVERLRLDNNSPLALHNIFLNHRLCPQILNYNLATESLFTILRENYQLKFGYADQDVSSAFATKRERELMSLPNPAPVLRTERTTFLESGEVIEFSTAAYCGDFYRIRMRLDSVEIQD